MSISSLTTVENSVFANNSAERGGHIFRVLTMAPIQSLEIRSSVLMFGDAIEGSNQSSWSSLPVLILFPLGGALFIAGGNISLNHTQIRDNTAESKGGGVYFSEKQMNFFNSSITNNKATEGGGIFVPAGSFLRMASGCLTPTCQTVIGGNSMLLFDKMAIDVLLLLPLLLTYAV